MLHPNNRGQVRSSARAEASPFRLHAVRESRCALALLVLLGLATVSVMTATRALSQDFAVRVATDLRP